MAARFPVRPPGDPAKIASGKALYSVNCSFCHGANAKGGEGGPNLIRSEIVLDDQHGEGIGLVVLNGRVDKGMPRFTLSSDQIGDIAAFLHSFPVGDAARSGIPRVNSLVGDATRGAAFFNGAGHCTNCHSSSGNLAGVGAKYTNVDLQNYMLMGGKHGPVGLAVFTASPVVIPPGTMATLTMADGAKVEGLVDAIDEFMIRLKDPASGTLHTYVRNGAIPKVQIDNPLEAHMLLLHTLQDSDIQDLTAYLATLK